MSPELALVLVGALLAALLASHAHTDHVREKKVRELEDRLRELEIRIGGDPIKVKVMS